MIAEIRLQQYRSYIDKTFYLSPGLNLAIGPNASGKTNLLEAVMVMCSGKSYRTTDDELVMHNKDWARLDAKTETEKRTLTIERSPIKEKKLLINNKPYKRITSRLQLTVVLFEPNHLFMLSGSPEARRNYLDAILNQILPGYKKIKNDYIKVLRHRNALLKNKQTSQTDLFPWNVRLSQLGGYIAKQRNEITNLLNKDISYIYQEISLNKENINLRYKPFADIYNYESDLLNKLEQSSMLDLLRGYTTNGPHREDLEILINNKPPSSIASRGETRTILIALKMLEAITLEKSLKKNPIILLDDVFSELDKNRIGNLTNALSKYQTIITTTDMHLLDNYEHNSIITTEK